MKSKSRKKTLETKKSNNSCNNHSFKKKNNVGKLKNVSAHYKKEKNEGWSKLSNKRKKGSF